MPGRMRVYCMTGRLHAWLRQAHSDLAMAAYANQGGFHVQVCYHCSQAGGAPCSLRSLVRMTGAHRNQAFGLR